MRLLKQAFNFNLQRIGNCIKNINRRIRPPVFYFGQISTVNTNLYRQFHLWKLHLFAIFAYIQPDIFESVYQIYIPFACLNCLDYIFFTKKYVDYNQQNSYNIDIKAK